MVTDLIPSHGDYEDEAIPRCEGWIDEVALIEDPETTETDQSLPDKAVGVL